VLKIPKPPVLITADMVETGKPSPEGYLLGRECLGVSQSKQKVIVVEDAAAGVRAGKAAGATVIGVLETHSREALETSGADYIVNGLHEVRIRQGENDRIIFEF
jgi:glycerol-1-phosphatase